MTSARYVAPFLLFLAAAFGLIPELDRVMPPLAVQALFIAAMAAVIRLVAWPALDFRVRSGAGSLLVGAAVFAAWIAPDLLFPGYREHWLFSNVVTGLAGPGLRQEAPGEGPVLLLRSVRAAVIVPVVEELFWRAWLMRWLISHDFGNVPLGAYSAQAFWVVAALFASEHGPYWDVGLAAGAAYNWWMVRTRSLGDLILTHGVTNACLSIYIVAAGRWEYWA